VASGFGMIAFTATIETYPAAKRQAQSSILVRGGGVTRSSLDRAPGHTTSREPPEMVSAFIEERTLGRVPSRHVSTSLPVAQVHDRRYAP